jgi:CHAD domain-containing protein
MVARKPEKTGVIAYLDELVAALRRLIPGALERFDEESIHQARVATRRLKAAVELLAPTLRGGKARRFSRAGRKLRRQLGPLRDLDVMIGHLAALRAPSLNRAIAWLQNTFAEARRQLRAEVTEHAPASRILARLGSWDALRESVLESAPAIPSLTAEAVHTQLDKFEKLANAEHGDPHELRIAGKAARYTLELAKVSGQKLPSASIKTFKKMQQLLGAWHDQVVLAEAAMRQCARCDLPLHDAPLQREMLKLIDLSMKRAERNIGQFHSLWNAEGAQLLESIRASFQLTRPAAPAEPVSEPKTDPDPSPIAPEPVQEAAATIPPPAA